MKRKEHIETGDAIYTPRFCSVTIDEVFENCTAAKSAGYTEPTYYKWLKVYIELLFLKKMRLKVNLQDPQDAPLFGC